MTSAALDRVVAIELSKNHRRRPELYISVAVGEKYEIGVGDRQLLGRFTKDMQRFTNLTTGQVVIMGRKTFESFPSKPLRDRINIVLTSSDDLDVVADNLMIVHSVEEARGEAEQAVLTGRADKIFVIGGEEIYRQFLAKDLIDSIYLTRICGIFDEADKFFPSISSLKWKLIYSQPEIDPSGVDLYFEKYVRLRT